MLAPGSARNVWNNFFAKGFRIVGVGARTTAQHRKRDQVQTGPTCAYCTALLHFWGRASAESLSQYR